MTEQHCKIDEKRMFFTKDRFRYNQFRAIQFGMVRASKCARELEQVVTTTRCCRFVLQWPQHKSKNCIETLGHAGKRIGDRG